MTPTDRRRLGLDVRRCAALVTRLDAAGLGRTSAGREAQRWLSAALSAATAVMSKESVDDYAFPGFDDGRGTAVQVDNSSSTDCAK